MLLYTRKGQTWLWRQKNGIIKKKIYNHCIGACLGLNRNKKVGNTELCLIRIRELRWQITKIQEVVACQLSDSSLILSNWILQGNTEVPEACSSLQEYINFLTSLPWADIGAAACKKLPPTCTARTSIRSEDPLVLNYNGSYLIMKGIVHSAEQCPRKSIWGVLSLLLLSRENKVHVAHKSEVTSSSGHKQQGREQHALLKSQLHDRSLVMAAHKMDCKSEICSNARAALFFPFLPINSTTTPLKPHQGPACSQACFLTLLWSQAISGFWHFCSICNTFSKAVFFHS